MVAHLPVSLSARGTAVLSAGCSHHGLKPSLSPVAVFLIWKRKDQSEISPSGVLHCQLSNVTSQILDYAENCSIDHMTVVVVYTPVNKGHRKACP